MPSKIMLSLLLCCLALAAFPATSQAKPPLASQAAGDEFWDSQFVPPGVEGAIYALALDSSGELYAGGAFRTAGGVTVNNIARWDGRIWRALGGGLNGPVNTLAFSGTELLIGGGFSQAGGAPAAGLARWDGATWRALGGGVSGGAATVNVLRREGTALYVGGNFTKAGASTVSNLARWDGAAWSNLGGGVAITATTSLSPTVSALALRNGVLYAAGSFSSAGGVPAANIASWNGSAWAALGGGVNGLVKALLFNGSTLYAGGAFSTAGGVAAARIARWEGGAWAAVGSLPVPAAAAVAALIFHGGKLYAGVADPGAAASILTWSGSAWTPIGPQFAGTTTSNSAYAFVQNRTQVYVGGHFTLATEGNRRLPAYSVLRLTGAEWEVLGRGNALVCADFTCSVTADQRQIYIASDLPASFVLPYGWRGFGWEPLSVPSGFVAAAALASAGDTLYAADSPSAGGPPWQVARRNGTTWSLLGGGLDGRISQLAAQGDTLYAAYRPAADGTGPGTAIARWDGRAWADIGALTGQFAAIQTMHISGTELYAGGSFASIGGVAARNIARWNGSGWSALGTPPAGEALSIISKRDGLYAAFDMRVARWDGAVWTTIGTARGTPERTFVLDLAVVGDTLFAAGQFAQIDSVSANRIARWDGTTWQPLGSGISGGEIIDLATQGDNLYLIGQFSAAGGKPAQHVARWNTVRILTYVPWATADVAGGG